MISPALLSDPGLGPVAEVEAFERGVKSVWPAAGLLLTTPAADSAADFKGVSLARFLVRVATPVAGWLCSDLLSTGQLVLQGCRFVNHCGLSVGVWIQTEKSTFFEVFCSMCTVVVLITLRFSPISGFECSRAFVYLVTIELGCIGCTESALIMKCTTSYDWLYVTACVWLFILACFGRSSCHHWEPVAAQRAGLVSPAARQQVARMRSLGIMITDFVDGATAPQCPPPQCCLTSLHQTCPPQGPFWDSVNNPRSNPRIGSLPPLSQQTTRAAPSCPAPKRRRDHWLFVDGRPVNFRSHVMWRLAGGCGALEASGCV